MELATALRSCGLLLTFSQNEACPNHVLEAMASGLPILFEDSGAMAEIIGNCGLQVHQGTFRSQFEKLKVQIDDFGQRARDRSVRFFHPDIVFPKYVEAIHETVEKPTRVPRLSRMMLAWANSMGF